MFTLTLNILVYLLWVPVSFVAEGTTTIPEHGSAISSLGSSRPHKAGSAMLCIGSLTANSVNHIIIGMAEKVQETSSDSYIAICACAVLQDILYMPRLTHIV